MTKLCVIFDLDGTLADVRHRLHHVRKTPPDWPAFFDACVDDPPHEYVLELNRFLHNGFMNGDATDVTTPIFICSGRPDTNRRETEAWLKKYGVVYDHLLMREADDRRPDVVVKKEMLDGIRGQGFEPVFAVDDRPSVVAMWRENGVPCLATDDAEWKDRRNNYYAGDLDGQTLLTLMVGPTQAGKSSLLETWGKGAVVSGTDWYLHPQHVISSDQVRRDLHGGEYVYDPRENERVFGIVHAVARTRMENGLPVVIDATNLRRKNRLAAVDLAPAGTRVRYAVMDRYLELKLATRRPDIPEEVVVKHHHDFRSSLRDILAGDRRHEVDVLDLRGGA